MQAITVLLKVKERMMVPACDSEVTCFRGMTTVLRVLKASLN